jgi:hypothetical protein
VPHQYDACPSTAGAFDIDAVPSESRIDIATITQ